jgi:DNA-binding protein H-NS
MMNREIIRFINPKYRFVFVGLDGGTEADRIEMNIKRLKYYTLDELRASEDMEPLENGMGKIVDNTSFLQVYLEQMKEKQAEKMAKKQQDFTMKQGDVDFQRQQDMAQEQQKFEAEQALEQQKQELDAQKEQAKTEKKANKAAKKVQKSLTDNTWDLDDQEALTDEIQKGLQTGDFSKAVGMINDEKVVINLEV